jgi:type IV pilus assembly protein PilV
MFEFSKTRNLKIKSILVHKEPAPCHSEPFALLRTGSAKKETICHPERRRRISRFFVAPLLRMTWRRAVCRLTLISDRGLTLLEVLAAMAILAFGLLAIATMQATSVKGNSQAIGITEAVSLAQDKVEELMRLPYDDPADNDDPLDDNGGGASNGTNQDADDDGADDDGGNFGLDDTVDGGGNVIADELEVNGRYTIYWNIAVDEPLNNVKTVRIIVVWTDRGTEKRAVVDFMKSNII